jgi:hypothetical protein
MSNLKSSANRLKNRSDNRSEIDGTTVGLTINRAGVPVQLYVNHLQDVLQHGTAGFMSAIDESVAAGCLTETQGETVKNMADFAETLWQQYKGKANA